MRPASILFIVLVGLLLFCAPGPALGQQPPSAPILAVTAAMPRDFPPQYSLDDKGRPTGFAIEVMDKLAQLAGLDVTYQVEDTWEAALEAVRQGRAHLIPNLGVVSERRGFLDFTPPVETFDLVLFVRAATGDVHGLKDLAGRRVGAVLRNLAVTLLAEDGQCLPVLYGSPEEGLARLLAGDVDAMAYPQPVFLELARRARVEALIKVAGPALAEVKRAVAVSHDHPELLERLSRAVTAFVGSTEYRELVTRWYGRPLPLWTPERVALAMGLLLAAVTLGMLTWRARTLRAANRALASGEERYRMLMENAGEAIVVAQDQLPVFFNSRALEITGLSAEQFAATPFSSYIHPRDREMVLMRHQSRLRGEEAPSGYDFRIITANNGIKWLRINSVKITWQDRPATLSFISDVTQQKNGEEALARSEERYRRIVETASEGIWVIDEHGRTTFVNRKMAQMLGYVPDEMQGRAVEAFVHPEDMELHRATMERRRRGQSEEYEIRRVGKDGRVVWCLARATPMIDAQGRFVGSFAMFTDISERKAAQESRSLALEQLRARTRETAALLEGARAVMGHQDFEPVARAVFGICRELVGAGAGYVALLTEDGQMNEVLFLEAGDRPCTVAPDLPMPIRGLRAEAYVSGEVVLENDFSASVWMKYLPAGHVDLDNVLFAPLNIEGHTMGVIGLANKPGGFTDNDARLAGIFGEIAAVGLRNARLLKNLETGQARFRNLFENMSAGVAVYEAVDGGQDFIFRDLNKAGEVICQVQRETVLGRRVSEAFPGVKAFGLFDVLRQVHDDNRARTHSTGQYKDHRLAMWVENYVYKLPNGEVVAIFDDVTARRQAEDGLRESEAAVRGLLDATTDSVFLLAGDLKVLAANESAAQGMGCSPAELIGRSALDLFPPEVARERGEKIAQVVTSGRALKFRDQWDGQYFDNQVFPILDTEGQVHRFGLYSRDVSEAVAAERERKRLESQLLQSQKMEAIGTLAGGIAHDFNNILGAIMGFTEMALEGADPERSRDMGEVLKAAERARDLVKQILTFSHRVEVELKPLDLNKEVIRTADLLKRTLPKMIAVQTRLASDLKIVRANANQIEQVLLNLGANAADAMPEGGRLALETGNISLDEEYCRAHVGVHPGDYVLMSVSDTGQGMDQHTMQHIFDPFFTTKAVGQGTGLGLATVYGIVKGHGGNIWCYSEPGLGATFKIYLPVFEQTEAVHPADPAPPPPELPRGHETILLVDDEAALRALGARTLSRQGYAVLSASSGEEALAIYQQRREELDLVVLDLGMPGMGGHQCLLHILAANPQARVIIASGYAADGRVKESLAAGAHGYVAKPFRREELALTVRAVLDGEKQ